jgi:hypothetical protein
MDIQLITSNDQPMWRGDDRTDYLTAHDVYIEIANHTWPNATGGWRHHLWSWNLSLKTNLFLWLTLANNINIPGTSSKKKDESSQTFSIFAI